MQAKVEKGAVEGREEVERTREEKKKEILEKIIKAWHEGKTVFFDSGWIGGAGDWDVITIVEDNEIVYDSHEEKDELYSEVKEEFETYVFDLACKALKRFVKEKYNYDVKEFYSDDWGWPEVLIEKAELDEKVVRKIERELKKIDEDAELERIEVSAAICSIEERDGLGYSITKVRYGRPVIHDHVIYSVWVAERAVEEDYNLFEYLK